MYYLKLNARKREHPIDIKFKKVKKFKVQRKFIKEQSVFGEWIEPDYKKLLTIDFNYSKIPKIIKDIQDYEGVFELYLNNIHLMLDHFYYMIGHSSSYSQISWMDFSVYCKQLYLDDEKTLSFATIDLLFISSNSNIPEKPNQAKMLTRFEFFEIFIRIAKAKYMDNGKAKTFTEALQTLISNHFKGFHKYKFQSG